MGLRTQTGEPCAILVKIGQREHLEMLRGGLLYMNTLAYFAKLEAADPRSDRFEGTDRVHAPKRIRHLVFDVDMPGRIPHAIDPRNLVEPIRVARSRTSACNVFCMFTITAPIVGPVFSEGNERLGDYFVEFTNTPEFLTRIAGAVSRQGLTGEYGMVEYYDEWGYSGATGRFMKRSKFAHEREFRIVLEPGLDGPRRFEIGDLADITSEVTPLSVADDVLRFTPEDAIAAGLTWD